MAHVAVIGSGFSGLSAACFLAKEGFKVTVLEKNSIAGGRARKFSAAGFTFDMGPSWYWMPDVFDRFFAHFGKSSADYYSLQRLNPSYRVVFGKDDFLDLPSDLEQLYALFERMEPGSAKVLNLFLEEAKRKYIVGIQDLVYQPGLALTELLKPVVLKNSWNLHLLESLSSYINKRFKSPRLVQLLQFPVLFLGSTPEKTPALYTLMNYADMVLGTWYPNSGMFTVVDALVSLAESLGVKFEYNSNVDSLTVQSSVITGCVVNDKPRLFDYVVASADYQHVEQELLPSAMRRYSDAYWNKRVMAPSSLIFYLGINKQIKNLLHHTLFFDEDFKKHASEIYDNPQWPTAPQFYVSCTSKSDATVAPPGNENILILIPVATGLEDNEKIRTKYFDEVINRLENLTGESIRPHIVFKRSYAHKDFISDYNAYKGNAYGLANTLRQTANLRPSIVSKKVKNLFYTGHLTVPGPGVPPALISGEVVAKELIRRHNKK
jgi:phytoene desaturase